MKQEPTFTLYKLPEGFIVTSDEEIKEGDINVPSDVTTFKDFSITSKDDLPILNEKNFGYKKVIAQQNQLDFSSLKEEQQKKIGWFDVEKFKKQQGFSGSHYFCYEEGFVIGFNKSQELQSDMFTLDDMINVAKMATGTFRTEKQIKAYIQSLSKSKSWEVIGELKSGKFKILRIL